MDIEARAKASRAAGHLMEDIGLSIDRALAEGVSAARIARILADFAEDYLDLTDDSQWPDATGGKAE